MSIIDWLIVVFAILGALVLAAIIVGAWLIYYYFIRDVDDPDDLPAPPLVRTKIIRAKPNIAMARAACEAGYITNKDYLDEVRKAEGQAEVLERDLHVFTHETFQRPARLSQSPDWNGAA